MGGMMKMFNKLGAVGLAVAVMGLGASAAVADTIAYDNSYPVSETDPTPPGGFQRWKGNLGLDFVVDTPITVTYLGAFDNHKLANLDGSLGNGVDVAIFNSAGAQIGPSVQFNSSNTGTQVNGDAFLPVSISLGVGDYSIVALNDLNYNTGYNSNAVNPYSTENSGGAISFVGSGRYDINSSSLDLPGNTDGGPTNRYDAGTFAFTTGIVSSGLPVPLPASAGIGFSMLAGFGALAALRKRMKRRAAIS